MTLGRPTSIRFDWDLATHRDDALPLRKDWAGALPGGGWTSSALSAADSPGLWALTPTAGQTVKIRVRFATDTPGYNGSLAIAATGGGVLGAIDRTVLTFVGGQSVDPVTGLPGEVSLPLSRRTFTVPLRQDVAWAWRSGAAGGTTATAPTGVQSKHRVYLIPAKPAAPWVAGAWSNLNPWTLALDWIWEHALAPSVVPTNLVASSISAGHRTTKVLAARLLSAVWGAGFQYDTTTGLPMFRDSTVPGGLHLGDWLAGPGGVRGGVTNCYDLAAVFAALASLLGIPVKPVLLNPAGYVPPLRLAGVPGLCNNPFYVGVGQLALVGTDEVHPNRTAFGNHSVGQWGSKGLIGGNWDPTLRVEPTVADMSALAVASSGLSLASGASRDTLIYEILRLQGGLAGDAEAAYRARALDLSTAAEILAATPANAYVAFPYTVVS